MLPKRESTTCTFLYFYVVLSQPFPIPALLIGEEHISRTCQHPHFQYHRSAIRRAMVPCDSTQCSGQRRGSRRGQNHKCLLAAQVSVPDHEYPANGAVQRVCGVRHQQLPNTMCRLGATSKCQEQRRGGLCTGAHFAKYRESKGTSFSLTVPYSVALGLCLVMVNQVTSVTVPVMVKLVYSWFK